MTTQLDTDIQLWRTAVTRDSAVDDADADELEGHLREQIAELVAVGLSDGEAFQIAVQRLGQVDQLTAEFAREHGDRLWKQLTLPTSRDSASRRPLVEMIVFAALAAVLIQIARLLAVVPDGTGTQFMGDAVAPWFLRNLGLFVLLVLAGYFAWRRKLPARTVLIGAAVLAVIAALINVYPYETNSQTGLLVSIHLPVLLWFFVGATYLGGALSTSLRRMEFVRFTGEWAIYWVLLALGGGVLMALTALVLAPIAPEAIDEVLRWVLPSGGAAATVVAAWLVEAKKGVIENLAPVLAAIFTPLFAVMLIVASITYLGAGVGREFDRELLIVFDVLLIVVLALVLYALSARDVTKPAGPLDALRFAAVAAAVLLDLLVLGSMLARIAEFGFTPNRVAALGLNLILVVNLAVTGWYLARMLTRRASGGSLERWQTRYLPVFGAWAAVVVLAMPVLFSFT